jgi:hypothetical protein
VINTRTLDHLFSQAVTAQTMNRSARLFAEKFVFYRRTAQQISDLDLLATPSNQPNYG